jgi:hypothetical protein
MFPILKNKKFQDIATGKVVMVTDQFEDVAILEGKQRINVMRLMDKNIFSEFIDPETFFSQGSTLQALADKIRSISNEDLARIEDVRDDESLIIQDDPEEEKRRILEKYSAPAQIKPTGLEQFMDEDPDILVINPLSQPTPEPVVQQPRAQVPQANQQHIPTQARPEPEDPMVRIFRGAKRKTDFCVSIRFESRIPRPDFIEMMEDSYETSIIDYLAQEFTDQILSDPSFIRQKIKSEILALVYPQDTRSDPQGEVSANVAVDSPDKPAGRSRQAPKKKTKHNDDTPVAD